MYFKGLYSLFKTFEICDFRFNAGLQKLGVKQVSKMFPLLSEI